MTNAEHLIDNMLYGMYLGWKPQEAVKHYPIPDQLKAVGIKEQDMIDMAWYIVYDLYDGKFPDLYKYRVKEYDES